ncbi:MULTISPECIES: hypothetical protein [Pseudomonas]|uniref:Uncharacterized protein n=1 Tax=Pseudomonas bijieensis TaxID=2681983 RepID=A0A6N1CCM4_9PSED|nr:MULTISPECIES: hypothetical protein [Pseudomonas]QIB04415.1 hypothetical protein GZ982_06845 [Pseudomonas fluorescens]QKS82355.1 hypothetical protein GN234_10525 [Pseudomonas bijieensis]UQI32648.1 hypothetical protein M3M50_08490 [Pseudomonas bijieensis]WLH64448.1 hypothetical protein PSH86_07750 [Pseudomonas sp. FP2300]
MKRPDIDVYASMGRRLLRSQRKQASSPQGFLHGSANKRQDYVTAVGHFPAENLDNTGVPPNT